ncbi:pirin family protein [Alkalibaculum sp. M08DMB]|uniref:Pirin family protein n=1 Tax=Alkalibaculum sporogenes TaxID=2655001 RepID=A0A6A7KBU8_9FIRM|nr:pirin family protein [Alkalibaculum sporogenes]
MIRKIKEIVTGEHAIDGAGVNLVRVIGRPNVYSFDPFLMMDAFDSIDPDDYTKGFPWHPHRGIETITYLIKGDIEHGDSLGNKGRILDGQCQWMTAGSGIIHQEMPQASERMLGVQLWLNIPAKDKMTDPAYRDILSEMIPKIEDDASRVGILSGNYKDTDGAICGDYVKLRFLDVDIKPNREWAIDTQSDKTLYIYIIEGSGIFDEEKGLVESKRAILFEQGDQLIVNASKDGIRFLLFEGSPLKEPIAWGGPIVMNTQEELTQAFKDLDEGNFIK